MWNPEKEKKKGRTLPSSTLAATAGILEGGTTKARHWVGASYEANFENPKVNIWLHVQMRIWNMLQMDRVSIISDIGHFHILVDDKSRFHFSMLILQNLTPTRVQT